MPSIDKRSVYFAAIALCTLLVLPASADVVLTESSWETSSGSVHFQLSFQNTDVSTSEFMTGEVFAQQAYGAFLPNTSSIEEFDIPPIPPESFFDVFFDVPLDQLPPSADRLREAPGSLGPTPSACPADTSWAGNVDVIWGLPGFPGLPPGGNVQIHFGTMFVSTPGGVSYIHVIIDCPNPPGATWNFTYPFGPCPGWTVSLVQSDMMGMPNGPAANPLPASPPPFDGWICITTGPSVPVGAQCYVNLNVTCPGPTGGTATVQVCAEACDREPVPVKPTTWGVIKSLYR